CGGRHHKAGAKFLDWREAAIRHEPNFPSWRINVVALFDPNVGSDGSSHLGRKSCAAMPALQILPVLRIADTRLGLDIVEPGVLHALARGPNILARHRAGMTPDAFVEVQHHRDLRTYLHDAGSLTVLSAGLEWSSHSTLFSLRTMTNSSRFDPTVP